MEKGSEGLAEGIRLAGPRRRLAPGELVANRYLVLRTAGEGGGGVVYETEDMLRGRKVALKTFSAVADSPRLAARYEREIKLAQRLRHPNVCRIFDSGCHYAPSDMRPIPFLTMEFLEGETLRERVRRQGRMTPQEALPLVTQMAAALFAAHRAGVLHCDFKSENVLLVPAKKGVRVVVTDFGLARDRTTEEVGSVLTASSRVLGTPIYMAPEQVEGKALTPASDLYAFGVVLYEMVTGSWPFFEATPLATAVKRLHNPPPSPRQHVPDLDPLWEKVILRLLAVDPEKRFASAVQVMRALQPRWSWPQPAFSGRLTPQIAFALPWRIK